MSQGERTRDASGVAVEHTLQFLKRTLPRRVGRALEIGCGDGRLAQRLASRVGELVAIDIDPALIKSAKKRGIDARAADWLKFDDGTFDVIVFSRSLHHIERLDDAIERAVQRLKPGGALIVEDFAFETADARTVDWLRGTAAVLHAGGAIDRTAGSFIADLLAADDALSFWRGHHGPDGHGIHQAADMGLDLRDAFSDVCEETAPYLYRYLCDALTGARSAEIAAALLDAEEHLIQSGGITAVGRRWVVTEARQIRS
jgi:SAM-dependent methyltransferase